MENYSNKKSIREEISAKIKSGQVKMKPKAYFVFKICLLAFGVIALTLSSLFITSFIFFSIRAGGLLSLLKFGVPGIRILLFSLPWLLILGAGILIATSEIFAKHFSFVYRRPILYSGLAILLIVILGGSALERTRLHSNLFFLAQNGRLPIAGRIYREFGMPEIRDAHYGVVFEITNGGFRIKTPQGEEFNIIVTAQTQMPPEKITKGEIVIVLGERGDHTIYAQSIRDADENREFFPGQEQEPPARVD